MTFSELAEENGVDPSIVQGNAEVIGNLLNYGLNKISNEDSSKKLKEAEIDFLKELSADHERDFEDVLPDTQKSLIENIMKLPCNTLKTTSGGEYNIDKNEYNTNIRGVLNSAIIDTELQKNAGLFFKETDGPTTITPESMFNIITNYLKTDVEPFTEYERIESEIETNEPLKNLIETIEEITTEVIENENTKPQEAIRSPSQQINNLNKEREKFYKNRVIPIPEPEPKPAEQKKFSEMDVLDGGTRKHHKHNKTHKTSHKNSNRTKKHRKNRKHTLKRK